LHLYFRKALKTAMKAIPFIIARLELYGFFSIFSFLLLFGFSYISTLFSSPLSEIIILAGFVLFFFCWVFFRRKFLSILELTQTAIIAEILQGREIPSIKAQLSFGLKKAREKFGSVKKALEVKEAIIQILKEIHKKDFSRTFFFVPNLLGSTMQCIFSYIYLNLGMDTEASARDSIILFHQRKKRTIVSNLLLLFFSYLLFFLLFLVFVFIFRERILAAAYFFKIIFVFAIFLLAILWYETLFSPLITAWQIVLFVESIKADSPKKNTRDLLEQSSQLFDALSANAKTFAPSIPLTQRDILSSVHAKPLELKKEITAKAKGEARLEEEIKKEITKEREKKSKQKEPFEGLLSKMQIYKKQKEASEKFSRAEFRQEPKEKKDIKTALQEEAEKKKALDVTQKLLDQLVEEIGADNKYDIVQVQLSGEGWSAIVKINTVPYYFKLDLSGRIVEYSEINK